MKEGILLLFKLYKHHKKARRRLKRLNHWKRYHIIGYKPSGLPITKNPPMPIRKTRQFIEQLPLKDWAIIVGAIGSFITLYSNNYKDKNKEIERIEQVRKSTEDRINKIISEQYKNK